MIIDKIVELDMYPYIMQAKEFFRKQPKSKLWEELQFLSSDYSAEDYLNWCVSCTTKLTIKERVKKVVCCLKQGG